MARIAGTDDAQPAGRAGREKGARTVGQQELIGGFAQWLGLELVEATGDRVVVTWKVRPELLQPYGIVHGGVHCSVVETAASIAAALWYGDRGQVVGVSNQTDFLRAVHEGELRTVATPVHRGRLQQLWAVEISDEQERTVARGQVRLQNIEHDHFTREATG
jgi:1,4-dihydroxy-2-naphthoyl-CoA hydrolase